ncbi:hypothetical protein NC653_008500 [Populus alba x Populus x berolinensis]|uniref:VWFA domain-containing protein n=2 Tax=Populus alba x Populus x berolinensis TaxID=444605 RepID=A0AAD6R6G8_9ROSI|nr:hypothetical protein NC653_008500 [Populus alba x Populus x berolinensis]
MKTRLVAGVEVDVPGRSYHSQLIEAEDANYKEKVSKGGNGRFMRGSVYTFKIPQVEGGATVSIKVIWSQKLLYHEGQFSLNVPFSFPAFVNPVGKKISKREKILLNVSSGVGKEILCKSTSHALKELRREVGKMGFLYDAEVLTWSSADFSFSYNVYSKDLFGGVLLQSPLLRDIDDRQMFCFYLFPGNNQSMKAFRKEVIFIIDISRSMKGGPFESAKNGLLSSLQKLNPEDSFNIIAFNVETYLFSSVMEQATEEAIIEATRWLNDKLTADGGTNILVPLKQAIKLLAETTNSIPVIFLITDGAVEDERDICNFVKGYLTSGGSISLRISTFGIGTYCNHHFLRMLAQIGRGHFDTAYDADSVDFRMQKLFTTASSIILADITVDALEHLDSLEHNYVLTEELLILLSCSIFLAVSDMLSSPSSYQLLPFCIPDLSRGSPLIVSGRYSGNFPDPVKISGTLADMRKFTIDLKAQKTKDLPFDRVVGRRQIDLLTANAWLSGSKELEQKVAKMSIQTGFPSEYTLMVLHQTLKDEKAPETILIQDVFNKINPLKKMDLPKTIMLGNLCVGFGNLTATAENIPPGTEETKSSEAAEMLVKAASNCFSSSNSKSFQMIPRLFFSVIFLVLSASFPISGSEEKEKTLAMIKPDGLLGNYTERIKEVIVDYGFSILREITAQLDQDSASSFYAEHSSRSFFPSLINYMTSCKVLNWIFLRIFPMPKTKKIVAFVCVFQAFRQSFDSGPVLVMVLEKENAIADWRSLIGPTDACKAKITHPNSIRAMCGQDSEKNCVHGSDSLLSAQREISFFFEDVSSVTTHRYDMFGSSSLIVKQIQHMMSYSSWLVLSHYHPPWGEYEFWLRC